jgi:putative tryptophan/tyrosine transport system substrate-binding protein
MRRRAFIGVLGGAAAWPLTAHAQPNRVRRVGVLMGYAETDPTALAFLAAFKQGLAALRWSEGKNLYIEVRWTAGDVSRAVSLAKELVALQPDAILANTTPVAVTLQRETKGHPHCIRGRGRPCRQWLSRKRGASWRQYHRLSQHGRHAFRKMARTT